MSENGKGDTPRPLSVSIKTYQDNYERIFSPELLIADEREPLPQDILNKLTQIYQEMGEYEPVSRKTEGNDQDGENV